jgi:hypothetical protein
MVDNSISSKISTIKLSKATKDRIDKLRVYKRETYEEILQKMLETLNLLKVNPDAARRRLGLIDRRRKKDRQVKPAPSSQPLIRPGHFQPARVIHRL